MRRYLSPGVGLYVTVDASGQRSAFPSASSYRYLIKSIPTSSDLEEAGSAMIGRESSVYKDVIAGRSSA